jgi:arsenite-transporting ATPase
MLRRMAESIYGDDDPTKIYFVGRTHGVEKKDGRYILSLPLPFVEKQDLQLTRSGDELIVHIGNRKRNLILPRVLATLDIQSARFDEDTLMITFGTNEE